MKALVLTIVFCLATITGFSQEKQITRDEFYKAYRSSVSKILQTSWRSISVREQFSEGVLIESNKTVEEYIFPNKRKYIETNTFKNKIIKSELIQIGEVYYCRKDENAWEKSDKWCAGLMVSGLPNAFYSKYTVKETKFDNVSATLYQQYLTYKRENLSNKDTEKTYFFESKFWLNDKGLILRRETQGGLLESKSINEKRIETYKYNPKDLAIEAPIK